MNIAENAAPWWNSTVFYEVYISRFCDSNGDKVGDFPGLTSKLPYLKKLGINGIWLTPFYLSPKIDNGYDIADYYQIDPSFGSLKDFDRFMAKAKKLGIRVIIDLVLNHTSTSHHWFQEAYRDKKSTFRDYYIWQDKPNNWESFFGGSAWEKDQSGTAYYYHAFAPEQADLNWSNPEVQKAMFAVMDFWLKRGVDGFRLDVINFLKSTLDFTDNPYSSDGKQIHLYDQDCAGILPLIRQIRKFCDQYGEKLLVGEVGSEDMALLKLYTGREKLHTVFNFNLGSLKTFDLVVFFKQLELMAKTYNQKESWSSLFFSSHDMPRFQERFEFTREQAKLLALLQFTFPGLPFVYYGEEIFLANQIVSKVEDIEDVQGRLAYQEGIDSGLTEAEALQLANSRNRDFSRGWMKWDFSLQEEDFFNFYQRLIDLRKNTPALTQGEISDLKVDRGLISYSRKGTTKTLDVLLNFGKEELTIFGLREGMKVVLSTVSLAVQMEDDVITLSLPPYSACILEQPPIDEV